MSPDPQGPPLGARDEASRSSPTGYWMCGACRIRVADAERGTELIAGSSCPRCGEPLQPVEDLAEVRGFRSPRLNEARTPRSVIARVAQILARRDAASAQIKRDGARLAGRP